MASDQPGPEKSRSALRFPLRNQSALGFLGAAMVFIVLAALASTVWFSVRGERRLAERARAERVGAVSGVLAKTVEALLNADEISTLRRVISEAGIKHDFELCRVLLPDGRTIADADPSRITLGELPDKWADWPGDKQESLNGQILSLSYPIETRGRGGARLEIEARAAPKLTGLGAYTSRAVIVALALIALLLVYRQTSSRLHSTEAVRHALLAFERGVKSPEGLAVSPKFGPEAKAWNTLLAEKEDLQKQVALTRAKASVRCEENVSSELGAACDVLPQGLILVDKDKRMTYANGAAAVLLQKDPKELLGADISEVIDDQTALEAVERASSSPSYRRTIVEVERQGAAGGGVLRFIVRPVRREDAGIAMVIIEDITQQRVAEKARNAFLAQATHELRTPLTNIRLHVETALEEDASDPAATAKCLNVVNEESRRLERIVSDILSVSEIEAGSFRVKRDDVRLDVLFEQIKADFEPQANEKQVELAFDLPPKLPVLQADRDKVALALHNLVGNALKYTPAGGKVTVNGSVDQHQIALGVTDTGLGISEGDAEKIFEKFYRAKDKRVAEISGSGLGLSLAREVIRLHGGDITVQSELDKGSTFTLTLPLSGEAA